MVEVLNNLILFSEIMFFIIMDVAVIGFVGVIIYHIYDDYRINKI